MNSNEYMENIPCIFYLQFFPNHGIIKMSTHKNHLSLTVFEERRICYAESYKGSKELAENQ